MADELGRTLQHLQEHVDLRLYQSADGSPIWLDDLASRAGNDWGALALLGPGGIRVASEHDSKGVKVSPDPADILLAGLAGRVRQSRERIALGLPPAARHLPLLLASSAVLADTLEQAAEGQPQQARGVLVVSRDLDIRSRYCDLYVGDMSLDEAKPGTRMRPDGEYVLLRPSSGKSPEGGVCFFLPQMALPDNITYRPSLVILDVRYAVWIRRTRSLAEWASEIGKDAGILALYTVGDSDTLKILTDAGFSDLPIDHDAVATCTAQMNKSLSPNTGTLDWALAATPSFLDRQHDVREITAPAILDDTFSGIAQLLEEHREVDSFDLNRARWLLAALAQLPVPIDWYERAARDAGRSSLRRMIARLGTLDPSGDVSGAVLGTLRMAFEKIFGLLGALNPRAELLRSILPEVMQGESREKILLLVRDQTMARAARSWLAIDAFPDASWLANLDVLGCPDYSKVSEQPYAKAVINGMLPRRYRWILGGALGPQVIYLAYQHELDAIEHQLQTVYGQDARSARSRKRQATVTRSPASSRQSKGTETPIPNLVLKRPARRARSEETDRKDRGRTLHDLADLAKALEEMKEKIVSPSVVRSSPVWEDDVKPDFDPDSEPEAADSETVDHLQCIGVAVESRLHSEGMMWLPVDGLVEGVRPTKGEDILLLSPQDLKVGDVIVTADVGLRSSLFERMVDLASDQPNMRYLSTVRQRWLDAMQALQGKFTQYGWVNYPAILRTLRSNGATITTEATVRNWITGHTIGPDDESSIIAVGKTVNHSALVNQSREMQKAFNEIRAVRRGIGMRLSGLIRKTFHHVVAGAVDERNNQMDDRLSLPLNELLDTVDLARVTHIDVEITLVPPQRTRRWLPAS